MKVGAKLRTKGTEFAQYQGQKRAKTPPHTTTKNTIWRDEHAKLLAIVEAGRQEKRAKEYVGCFLTLGRVDSISRILGLTFCPFSRPLQTRNPTL